MIRNIFFVARIAIAWGLALLLLASFWSGIPFLGRIELPIVLFTFITLGLVVTAAFSHLRRVRLIAGSESESLGNRQRRQIEIPFEAGEAFDLLDAAIRELPRSEEIESARDSLQVRAKVQRPRFAEQPLGKWHPMHWFGRTRNQIAATVTPVNGTGSVTLICEPESGAWSDWFRVDDGTNLENANAITRAITRRVADRRRNERDAAAQTATEKELTVARLNLLHAQVEPHFLYNTLASAQYLTRTDPVRADEMLGHLIQYLRHSLPRTQDELATLGDELERALAYLEILKIRMGQRLGVQVDVPESLRGTQLPPMMLQTLVENAIKHGLEPRTAGGTVWIRARAVDDMVAVTVADDGEGFNVQSSGTGIGLKNVRERLQLVYAGKAALAVVANFPSGVAATITVPAPAVPAPVAGTPTTAAAVTERSDV
ncbi:sensor histidine kinase [Lysobacter solisilvae (ex Woo and Kim 2022)]|uniref:sensor histidine kinase n=1 Tax=Agrilutibacter terrestris TaxID=2865112 RepID=UPI001CEC2457|nr:histidine kinase [Lysobacter terrestris]